MVGQITSHSPNRTPPPPPGRVCWRDVPTVRIPLVKCPSCGSTSKQIIVSSRRRRDGGRSRRCVCRACGSRFMIIYFVQRLDG
jgi:hypothetical protein